MATPLIRTGGVNLEELLALGEDARVEVIEGVIRRMSPVGVLHHIILNNLYLPLASYVQAHDLGSVLPDGVIYLMGQSSASLRSSFVPDLGYIRAEDVPSGWQIDKPYPGAPTLAVEIMSPQDLTTEIVQKTRTYLAGGTLEVWIIYPESREIHRYRAAEPAVVRVYREGETFEPEALFPGLTLSVNDIFRLPPWASKLQDHSG